MAFPAAPRYGDGNKCKWEPQQGAGPVCSCPLGLSTEGMGTESLQATFLPLGGPGVVTLTANLCPSTYFHKRMAGNGDSCLLASFRHIVLILFWML